MLDYTYLLERGYPTKASLKLVGDRYRLSASHRTILFRGVTTREAASRRRKTLTRSCRSEVLRIDGYNVLFTVGNYLLGRELFIAVDGFLRDAGETHGGGMPQEVFDRAVELTVSFLADSRPSSVEFVFDRPISHSGQTAARMKEILTAAAIAGTSVTEPSADAVLKSGDGVVATSDSAIIDGLIRRRNSIGLAGSPRTFDLARHVLGRHFRIDVADLGRLKRRMKLGRGASTGR